MPRSGLGPFLYNLQMSSCPKAADQTRDVNLVFGGNRSPLFQGHDMTQIWTTRGSTGQDPTVVPGGITGYSHQAVPHYLRVSSSACLYHAHILMFLFLFHFFTTYLILLEGTMVSKCLGFSQG